MTNHWIDIGNADVIMIIGSNPAENHPISWRWVEKAREKNGAKVISVDPRYTRTSAQSDIFVPLRSGTDIAFIGGIINHIIKNERYNRDYVAEYTNGSFLVDKGYEFDPETGLFSGYNEAERAYDTKNWAYQTDAEGVPTRDTSLTHPDCVFQKLRAHYADYTPEAVSEVTGTPVERLLEVYETYSASGEPGKSGTIMYAMGATQHTYGTQNVRSYAVLQLLLGNIGLAGGGVNALRGLHNVQGSTDMCLLFHILPGYLATPVEADQSLQEYLDRVTPTTNMPGSVNWWQHTPKYMVSLLKAWYGEAATAENEFGFNWLPKNGENYSYIALFEAMYAGDIKGLISFGTNPAVSGPNSNMERAALRKLDWMVAIDLWPTETANVWREPGVDSTAVDTEVFLLPAASFVEREGSVTNSGRWIQWRYKAIEPVGDSKPDTWIANMIWLELRRLYEQEGGPNKEAILNLTWDYGDGEPDAEQVAREISGTALADLYDKEKKLVARAGEQVKNFTELKDDGSTACGNWLYNYYTREGNLAKRRDTDDPSGIGLYSNWSWCWPINRRILYNRASIRPDTGRPWDPEDAVIVWDPETEKWVGDVPDGGTPPGTILPFIMKPEGVGRLFGMGRVDGPFPVHYEPWESPVENKLHSTQNNPCFKIWNSEMDLKGEREEFPVIGTTYRVSEMMQTGAMTRFLPWLVELQPELFVEMGQELAEERGIVSGEHVKVRSARGEVKAVAVVTPRFKPFSLNGTSVHEVGILWHYGYQGLATGDSGNLLTPHVGDANTMIPEYKAFLCDVQKA